MSEAESAKGDAGAVRPPPEAVAAAAGFIHAQPDIGERARRIQEVVREGARPGVRRSVDELKAVTEHLLDPLPPKSESG